MIQNVLQHLGGIQAYGIASLCLFVLAFGIVTTRAVLLKKSHLDRIALLPLEDESPTEGPQMLHRDVHN